jgi:PhnB protein
MTVKAIPEGYHSITPYLMFSGAAKALDYYQKVFGATEIMRMEAPDGKIGHAEIRIGDSVIMLADEAPEVKALSPKTVGGTPVGLMLYVENVDDVFKRAVAAGGTVIQPLEDKFYGDRSGTLVDPFGHMWMLATHKEDVAPEEMERRAQTAMKERG